MRRELIGLAGGAVLALPFAAQANELTFATFWPPGHTNHKVVIEPMIAELGDAIPMRLVSGAQLFGATAALANLGNRTSDIAPLIFTYTPSELRHVNILSDLMMVGDDALAMVAATMDTMFNDCPECLDDFRNSNVVHLSGFGSGGYVMHCAAEVRGLEDLKGKRIRTTGALSRFARALGATPVTMTVSDMVEGLQRGMVDCNAGPAAFYIAYSLQDSVRYVYEYDKGVFVGLSMVSMNRDAWNELSAENKRRLLDHMPRASARATVASFIRNNLRARAAMTEHGATITPAGDDIDAFMQEYRKAEIELTLKSARERRVRDPEAIVDAFLRNLEKWTGIVNDAAIRFDDIDEATRRYEALLRGEIYDKLDPERL